MPMVIVAKDLGFNCQSAQVSQIFISLVFNLYLECGWFIGMVWRLEPNDLDSITIQVFYPDAQNSVWSQKHKRFLSRMTFLSKCLYTACFKAITRNKIKRPETQTLHLQIEKCGILPKLCHGFKFCHPICLFVYFVRYNSYKINVLFTGIKDLKF